MVRTVRTSSKRQYGSAGRRSRLQQVSAVPLTGIRAEVAEIIASVPMDPKTGKAPKSQILKSLRAQGFEVRTSALGIGVRRKGGKGYTFLTSVKRPLV